VGLRLNRKSLNPPTTLVKLYQMSNRAIAAALFLGTLCAHPSTILSQEPDPRQSFHSAYSLYSSGLTSQAKEFFQQSLNAPYPLADYALYYLAVIAFEESDWQSSRDLLIRLRQEYPQSIWFARAQLQSIKIDIAEKNYPQAIVSLRSLRTEKNLKPEIAEEALYIEAQSHEIQGDVPRAHSLFQELRTSAPRSRWSAAARREVARLREKYPETFGLNTVTAISDEADQLAREREHTAAEALYKKLLNQDLGPILRLQNLTKLTDLYLSIRKRNEAMPLLEEIARDFPDKPEAAVALYRIGNILWNRNDNSQALEYFTRLIKAHPEGPEADRAQFAAADILESQSKSNEAIPLYRSLPKKFPNSQVRDDAIWRLAWLHYRGGKLAEANETFKSLASNAREERYRTAALYWQAKTSQQLGAHDTANRLYQQIFNQGPESYYQAPAAQALAKAGIATPQSKPLMPVAPSDFDLRPYPEAAFHLARSRELANLKLHALAVSELDEVNRITPQHPSLRLLLINEYMSSRAFARSVALAQQLPGSAGERLFHRYPLAYWETIQNKAREAELDPYLVVALIRQESLFDTRARSSAAALGLMQLLSTTASRVAKQLGLKPPSNEKLFDPELNVVLGTHYLKSLLRRYSNNWFKAIAAYNAGEAAVDRWEKDIVTDDIEEFVERIPYLETRQYVKLVLRNHRIYKTLYTQDQ
jgi:soluble lytic murein transglycosylase-like protein/outer membrane protein assembly factor BamD (BamD/ComL family)